MSTNIAMDERKQNSSISEAEDEEKGDIDVVRRQNGGRTRTLTKSKISATSSANEAVSNKPRHELLDCGSLYLSEATRPGNCQGKPNLTKKLNTQLLEAVANGEIKEIKRLLKLGANPNATCRLNHVSACHVAAMIDSDSLSLLMKSGAEAWRSDKLGRTPLHLAAWTGNLKQIAVLLNFPEDLQNKVVAELFTGIEKDVKKPSFTKHHLKNFSSNIVCPSDLPDIWQTDMEHSCRWIKENMPVFPPGWTALHAASARAQNNCIQLLLAAGADPTARDHIGSTPLNIVGEAHYWGHEINIVKQSIQIFIKEGGTFNDTQVTNLANTPLHTAVEVECERAVEELLNAGASVTCLNSKGLTAMHICVQKRLKGLLKLLVNYEFKQQDQSATVDAKDTNGMTILYAAVKTKWVDGMRIALNAGANVFSKANDGESPFHAAAEIGDMDVIQKLLPHAIHAIDFLNQKGETALIVALMHNHVDIVQIMAENGASLSVTLPNHQNVLQIAAHRGYRAILEYLLDYGGLTIENLINHVSDVNGRKTFTPIIYAVNNNYPDCVELLLKKGAHIKSFVTFQNDFWPSGRKTTALHVAAANNYLEIAKLILDHDCDSINKLDSFGQLPLHEACFQGHKDIISLFLKRGADLSRQVEYAEITRTPAQILMDNLVNPTSYMEEIFDSYISSENMNLQDKECKITVKYDILLPNSSEVLQMKVIKALVDTGNSYGQKQLLQHPLIESFLCLKWKALVPIFYGIIILHALFVLSLNIYVISIFYYNDQNNNSTSTNMYPIKGVPTFWRSSVWKYMIYVTVSIIFLKEIIVFIVKKINYLFFFTNWMKLVSMGLSTMLPSIVVWRDEEPALNIFSPEVTRHISTVALILSWMQMTLLLARFPCVGFYLMMFGKVAVKFCKIILSFTCLLIGSSLCFMVQFHATPPFDGPVASLTKTLVMMTAEYDYMTLIDKDKANASDATISIQRVLFVIFVIVTSLVLINLIVGVAVNDVNRLEAIGQQKRLEKQVEFLDLLENLVGNLVVGKFLTDKMYLLWSKRNNVKKVIVLKLGGCAKGKYNKILPAYIRDGLFEKAQQQTKQMDDEEMSVTLNKKLKEFHEMIVKLDRKIDRIKELNDVESLHRHSKKTEALNFTESIQVYQD